jgi:hypothetical protein
MNTYDYRNCQSLFGYAAEVHRRSGGVCELCGAGATGIDFDLWRQLTVEHLIGESQGGYAKQIKGSLIRRFPQLSMDEVVQLTKKMNAANTVTACSFCNSTTSRDQAPVSMTELIDTAPDGSCQQVLEHVTTALNDVLAGKRRDVRWKLDSVRKAFDVTVVAALEEARLLAVPMLSSVSSAEVDLIVERVTADVVTSPNGFAIPPGYAHLSLALIDAVYSIRSRYSAVKNVVAAYCDETGTRCDPLLAWGGRGFREHGLDDLLTAAGSLQGQDLADRLFGGSRSRSAGQLKADLCILAADRLQAVSVTRIEDLRLRAGDAEVRRAWTGVHGLGWVTWQYFCSLVGIDHFKPDVMLMRFVAYTLGRNVGPAETEALLSSAFERLQPLHRGLTKRTLDYTLWLFERDR